MFKRFAVKALIAGGMAFAAALPLVADTEIVVDGITWYYTISDGKAEISGGGMEAIPTSTTGALTIPSTLGGYPVTAEATAAGRV